MSSWSSGRGARFAMVLTPLAVMATFALGLRVGGRQVEHAAIVRAAPRARGQTAFAWQVTTLVDDRGVRETERRTGLAVRARAASGQEATWAGDSNADGVAEVRLDLPDVAEGAPLDLDVRVQGQAEPLAQGRVGWEMPAWNEASAAPFVRPSKQEGALRLDVAVFGGRLVPRVPTSLFVRVTSKGAASAVAGATLQATGEPGLDVVSAAERSCANGWARFDVSPVMFNAALSLRASASDGRSGEWFGELPVAPGAIVALPGAANAGETVHLDVRAPSERIAYVEVDDAVGRAFAFATALDAKGTSAAAGIDVPPLSPGLAWVVTSSEPRGAETLGGAALARPFVVSGGGADRGPSADACSAAPVLALHPAAGFPRWVALDGFVGRDGQNANRRRKGMRISLAALGIGAFVQLLLLLRSAQVGRAPTGASSSAWNAAIVILLALLGFALLAALLLARA